MIGMQAHDDFFLVQTRVPEAIGSVSSDKWNTSGPVVFSIQLLENK